MNDDFDPRLEKIRDRHRKTPEAVARPADPYDLREHTRDVLEGAHEKRPEVWNQVMERHGFRWYPPEELTRRVGPQTIIPSQEVALVDPLARAEYVRPHRVGQWRNDLHRNMPTALRTAFTVEDLFGLFGTPERFDEWFRERVSRFEARVAGVRLEKEKSIRVPVSSVPAPSDAPRVILAKR